MDDVRLSHVNKDYLLTYLLTYLLRKVVISWLCSRSRGETYIGHARLCVCVCLSTLLGGFATGHGFRCYDNMHRTRNVSECLYSLYPWLLYYSARI